MNDAAIALESFAKQTCGRACVMPPIQPVVLDVYKQSFTAFVGGAADKYQFLGRPLDIDFPDDIGAGPTGIMKSCMRKFKEASSSQITKAKFEYYGYEEAYSTDSVVKRYRGKLLLNLLTDIKNILKEEPNTQINLVGHSLGGWNVAGLSEELFKAKICTVHTLITIDPVGIRLSKSGVGNDRARIYYLEPDPVAKKWINIFSQPLKNYRDDYIAILGGRWNDDDTAKANFNSVSTYHHGEASEMFFEKKFLENKMSASDLLVSELKKVIK
ncbi:hypothetical protein MCL30_12680 [Acinetobacter pittii]|uniref:hypothetical protein n=1 Tax=Acinetobacter pittii TaxID=48296 RepID=UPI001EFC4B78|nr:hypothetical protein [Acinetobacter pittii]MCG9482635.1 hypothetical protein [Acinetobacter pittii]